MAYVNSGGVYDLEFPFAVKTAHDNIATQQATVDRIGKQVAAQQASIDQAQAQLASAQAGATRSELELKRQRDLASRSYATIPLAKEETHSFSMPQRPMPTSDACDATGGASPGMSGSVHVKPALHWTLLPQQQPPVLPPVEK